MSIESLLSVHVGLLIVVQGIIDVHMTLSNNGWFWRELEIPHLWVCSAIGPLKIADGIALCVPGF